MKQQSPKTKLYQAWKDMIRRCTDTTRHNYHRYGGRGITVCDQWKNSFYTFWEWSLKCGFALGKSLDRIDSNLHYCPNNCRWTTIDVQANNTRTNKFIEHNGERLTYAQWEKKLGTCPGFIHNRIKSGYSPIEAITKPPRKSKRRERMLEPLNN